MNHIYRSIWNQATGAYSAVSENVKSAGKRSLPGSSGGGASFALTSMAAAMMLGYGSLALAGPTGGAVVAGQAQIGGAPGATIINQGSQNAVINWQQFNIGKGESVQFVQPNSNAVALNRVLGNDGTTILGNLSANGKVFIVNPNGILFGQGASVNTAGLVASTLDISNADFMAGNYKFSGNGTGKVLNQGDLNAPGGYVALLGAHVSNEGTINARLGTVALAAGNAITLDVAGDGLLNVAVDGGAVGALVQNGGLIQADGGTVVLTAQAAGNLLKTVVNNTGVIEAHTIDTRSGTIKLLGDMQTGTVNAGGTLDASAPDGKVGSRGGFVDTSAAHVNIANGIHVTTRAANGLSGTWLIDPVDFTIAASGGNMTGTDLTNNLKNGAVQIQSTQGSGGTAGDINVNDVVSWSANTLTLTAQNNINVNAAMRGTGTASLALEYGQQAVATGNTSVYNVRSTIDLPSGDTFSTKLGSNGSAINYTVINSLGAFNSLTGTDLQGMRGNLSRNYALGSNIDATATATWDGNQGFTPVGNGTTAFTGKFDGLGHEISGLRIDRTNQQGGLFGEVGTAGVVRNVALANATVTIFDNAYGRHGVALAVGRNKGLIDNVSVQGVLTSKGAVRAGGLVGDNYGTINNSRSAGSVVYMQGYGYGAGGLVQINRGSGIIRNSSSSSAVNGGGAAGGLVRSNLGGISNSFATGAVTGISGVGGLVADNTSGATITNSFATGTVTANGSVGGLVGINNKATISNSYASGNVTKTSVTGTAFGGLVGSANSTSVISNSYALGNVTGWTTVGGIVGVNFGSVNNVYSNGTLTELTSGSNRKGGIVGDNTGGSVTNAYYNVTANAGVTGIGFSSSGGTGLTGTTGLTATQMMNPASFPSFTFTATPGLAGNNWVTVGANGAVNGTNGTLPMLSAEYGSTLYSAHQLQLMAMNLSGNYMLGNLLSAASTASGNVWGSTGFIPVGTSAAPFTGSLSGMGLSVSDLKIAKSGVSDVGLFGVIGATGNVSNLALVSAAVTGSLNVGAVAGTNQGTISGSYATGSVIGDSNGGGLVGNNAGTIVDSYASGSVGGNNTMGGLAGYNTGTISTSYANGAVSTGSFGGGLVGVNKGSVTGSYWDTVSSGQATSAGGIGLTTAQLKTLANYNSATAVNGLLNPAWELGNMWIVYDGLSAPLLRSFMKQLVVTVNSGSKVYDGTSTTVSGVGVSYSRAVDSGLIQGTLIFSTAGGAVNVGTYGLSASGLYAAGQGGYAITYVDGSLSITARQVSIGGVTAGKVYDGTTTAVLSGGSLTNAISADLVNLSITGLSGSYASQNAGSNVAINATATLGGSASANYILAPLTGITGNITQKALTLSGVTASTKVYDGNTKASLAGGTLNGLVGGETLSVSGLNGAFADKNAGTGKAVMVSGTTLVNGTGLASNYSVSNPNSVTGDITPKALTVAGLVAANKVYDGTTKATVTGGTLSGMVGGETLGLSGLSGAFVNKNAGTAKAVTISGATLADGTGLASNYTVSNPTGVTANINQATISSVTNVVADSKTYDGGTSVTFGSATATFNGMISGDSLGIGATKASFSDKNAGTGKAVTISFLTLGGTDAGNYLLASSTATGTGTITPKALTISGMTVINKVYDGTTKATLAGGSVVGLVGSESIGVTGLSATFDDKNAGTGKTATATGAALVNGVNGGLAANYTISNPTGLLANITPKALTVTGVTATTRAYDGTLAATLSGGSLSGLVSGETLTVSGGTGAYADKNAGTGKAVTVTGIGIADGTGLASNYTVSNPTGVTGTITQKALTVTGALAADKTYDGALTAAITDGTLSGLVGSETVNLDSLTGAFADKNAGSGKAVSVTGGTLSNGTNGGLASNYSVAPVTGLTASIAQKALTVTGVVAANKVYDATTQATVTGGALSGLVGEETLGLSGLSGTFASKNAGTAKAVTISGATLADGTGLASNYTVSNPTGVTANINQATISSVTNVVADAKTYDGGTSVTFGSTTATFNGMLSGDSLAIGATKASFSDKNAGTGKAVTISFLTLGGTDAGNYLLASSTATGTGTITPKALTITGMSALDKVYDGNTNAAVTGGALNGLISGETLGVNGLTVAFDNQNAGTGKAVTATGATLVNGTGGLASNYTVSNPTNLAASITPKALTVTGITAGSRVYDASTAATLSGGALNGLIGSETLVLTGGSGTFADKNAGTAKQVTVNGIGLADGTGLASNYTVSNPTGVTGTITPKALTVVGALGVDKVYDGGLDTIIVGASFDGLVGHEIIRANNWNGTFADKNVGYRKTVTFTDAVLIDGPYGDLASNYTITPFTVTASIELKGLTVTGATAANKVYDGTTNATVTGGVLNGLVGTETLALGGMAGEFADKNAGAGKTVTVSGATLQDGTGLASNYYVRNPSGLTADIGKATINAVTGITAGNKVYDGTTSAIVNTRNAAFDGMVAGDFLDATASGAFNDKNAATGKTVNISNITIGGVYADNYTLAANATTASATADIAKASISAVTGITAGNKVYDGTTSASINTGGAAFAGLVAGDSLSATASGAFADKNSAAAKTVAISGIVLGGTDAGNYTLASSTASATADIAKASISAVTGITAGNKVYDGTTNASLNLAGAAFTGQVAGDTLTLATPVTGAFSDKNAATGKTVTVSGLALAGADAGNYQLANSQTTTTANIAQATLAVKVNDADKDQGVANPAFSASYTGLVGSDTVAGEVTGNLAFSTPATTASAAGSYAVSAAGQSSVNYALAYAPGTLTVKPTATVPVTPTEPVTPTAPTEPVTPTAPTEALQSTLASVLGTINVAPSQGNMVQADMVATGTPVTSKADAQAVATTSEPAPGNAPVVQVGPAVNTNVLPGLRLSVIDTGLRLPGSAGTTGEASSVENP